MSVLVTYGMGTPVHTTSSLTHEGILDLRKYFRGHATVAHLGSSGVGKSTLINVLAGSTMQATASVRSDGKGRHTTTHRHLLRLPSGGLIIDTPGMRELQLWDGQAGLDNAFGDVEQFAENCRFSDCQYGGEPGFAVLDAVVRGEIAEGRLQSYQKLRSELAYLERKQDVRARLREKQRIKVQMKSLRDHPKYRR